MSLGQQLIMGFLNRHWQDQDRDKALATSNAMSSERSDFFNNAVGQAGTPAMPSNAISSADPTQNMQPIIPNPQGGDWIDNPEFMPAQEAVEGTGYLGSDQSSDSKLQLMAKMMGSKFPTLQAVGGNVFQDMFKPSTSEGKDKYYSVSTGKDGKRYGINRNTKQMELIPGEGSFKQPGISIGTSELPGYMLNSAQKAEQGYSKDDNVFYSHKTGPKIVGGRNKDEVSAGITAESIADRLKQLDEAIGDYNPNIRDSLDQLGLPDAWANMVRSPEGQIYKATYDSISSDIVKELSGSAATDQERSFIMNQIKYTPGDTNRSMSHKFNLAMQRINDINAKAGKIIDKPITSDLAKPDSKYTLDQLNIMPLDKLTREYNAKMGIK